MNHIYTYAKPTSSHNSLAEYRLRERGSCYWSAFWNDKVNVTVLQMSDVRELQEVWVGWSHLAGRQTDQQSARLPVNNHRMDHITMTTEPQHQQQLISIKRHTQTDKQIQRQRQWYGKQTTGVAVVYSINSSTHYTPATYSQRILYRMSQNIDPLIRCCCLYISLQFNPLNSANISS